MKNLFNNISHEERQRILEMHENATRRNYLTEQGVTPPQANKVAASPDKLTVLKTDESKRNTFAFIGDEDLRKYFGPNVLKSSPNDTQENSERHNLIHRPLKSALAWYAKTGKSPQNFKLSDAVSYIEKMFPGFKDDYAAITGTFPYNTPKLMKSPQLDVKFQEIYNNQLNKV